MQFRPITPLADILKVEPHPGQWFKRPDGTTTQFVGMRRCPSGRIAFHFCDTKPGESFADRTQRFARARWHLVHRHLGLQHMVERAPASVDNARLGAYARAIVANA